MAPASRAARIARSRSRASDGSDTEPPRSGAAARLDPAVGTEVVRRVILADQVLHERVATLVEPLRLPRRAVRERVRGEDGQRDRRVAVADDGVGELVGVDLAPADRLARRGAREPARVDA